MILQKRKAQNRAAQRAFRERKEKHLKDLETKVTELSKTQEADKHENGLLKAQVERLQIELREYRKRLSLNSTGLSRSPTLGAQKSQQRSNSGSANGSSHGNFAFDFPKFGGLPGSQIFGSNNQESTNTAANPSMLHRNSSTPPAAQTRSSSGSYSSNGPIQPPQYSRENSAGRSLSPQSSNGSGNSSAQIGSLDAAFTSYSTTSNMHGFASTLPQMSTNSDAFGDLFSPSILKTAGSGGALDNNYFASQNPMSNNTASTDSFTTNDVGGNSSTSGLNRAFQFNSGSSSGDSASPASSMSQWNINGNGNSSCGTSPEPSHGSPANKDKPAESFSEKINPSTHQNGPQSAHSNNFTLNNVDFNVPSLDSFDPVLFGDYRESHDAVVGGGDFTGGFFNEALDPAPFDYGSPSNLFGILQSPQQSVSSLSNSNVPGNSAPSKKCLEQCDKLRDGGDDDFGLPPTQPTDEYGLPITHATSLTQTGSSTDPNMKLISCNSIWCVVLASDYESAADIKSRNQLQANSDFQEGKFDLDGLCSELRSKARCSESGVLVDQDHVDAALRKLGAKDNVRDDFATKHLMFEQDSWENVLRKMGGK